MVFHRKTTGAAPPEPQQAPVHRMERPQPQAIASMSGHNSGMVEESLIGSDLSIEGHAITVRCKGALRVNGNIQADLHSRQLEVGRDAIITGSITAEAVDVHGRINGAILSNKVVLHPTAEVEGDISAQYLSIEHGASFDGRSRRVRDPAEIVPQLESAGASPVAPAHSNGGYSSSQPDYERSTGAPSVTDPMAMALMGSRATGPGHRDGS